MKPLLIILDRDGVINFDSEAYIKSPEEWIPIPGSLEAITLLSQQGYQVHVATNQSGIARNYYDLTTLERIHQKMLNGVKALGGKIDFIAFCPHGPESPCNCRKPKPGLFLQCLEEAQVHPEQVLTIGDSKRDLEAAKAAGCASWLVLTGNGKKTKQEYENLNIEMPCFKNLFEAVIYLTNSSIYTSKNVEACILKK
jgi:D-glycero-D-manno-heptose 1,7-bisphosphate phosphatase